MLTGALVTGVAFDGKRASGVRYRVDGAERAATAAGEVILAAGAINSPKLLELSGIGDPDVLGRHGIAVRHALAGVGANLQDHLQIRTVFRVTGARTLNQLANSAVGKAAMAAEYALFRRGPLSMAPSQLGIFSRSDATVATADLEYHIQPLSTDKLGDPLHPYPAVTVSVCNLRPESRGTSHIRSRDPAEQPAIRPSYLSSARDRTVALASVRQARRLAGAAALRRYAPEELLPGPAVTADADLLGAIGDIATTIFHPVGTCRMGADATAVVDADLRVHGLAGPPHRRCLDHADAALGQHRLAGRDDRREGFGPHPQSAPTFSEPAIRAAGSATIQSGASAHVPYTLRFIETRASTCNSSFLQPCRLPHEWRMMRSVWSTIRRERDPALPAMRSRRSCAKAAERLGWLVDSREERRGTAKCSTSSKQTSAMSCRTDRLRSRSAFTANRRQSEEVSRSIDRHTLEVGLLKLGVAEFEAAQAAGEMLRVKVVGLVRIASDVTPELAVETIGSLTVRGSAGKPTDQGRPCYKD